MKLPAAIATTALAVQLAGAPTAEVDRAYALVAEHRPDIIAHQDTRRGRKDLLHWQATFSKALTRTQTAVYETILDHYNYERGDAFPGYERIADLSKCCRRTAIRAVLALEVTGFLTVERRFRRMDRWDGRFRHDRTNVYRFVDGAPAQVAAHDGAANEASLDASAVERAADSTEPRPSIAPTPPRPTAPSANPFAKPTGDPYWDVFEAAFVLEHRAAYGKDSTPGAVRQSHLRDQASNALNELASECVAWGRDPERGLDAKHLLVAEDLARRLARAWIRLPGRDNRHRDRGHPLGWMCGDLTRTLCDDAVEGWKRAQRRLVPKSTSAERPPSMPSAPPDETAIKNAENAVVMRLVRQGVGFDDALRLGRAEGARVRAALGLAAPSLITSAAAERFPPLGERVGRAPPE